MSGILSAWTEVDNAIQNADSYLCSPSCPCNFNNTQVWTSNVNTLSIYNSWTKSSVGATKIQDCSGSGFSGAATTTVPTGTVTTQPSFAGIDQVRFAKYFALIEIKFSCTGFCKTSYIDPRTNLSTNPTKLIINTITSS